MLIKDCKKNSARPMICMVCGRPVSGLGQSVGVCPQCVCEGSGESLQRLSRVHRKSRELFNLPAVPPRNFKGLPCNLCFHHCVMGQNDQGYCGLRRGDPASLRKDGRSRGRVSSYFDPLPTNCVADWVCAGGTGAGYPLFAHDDGPEVGFYNLAVFFESCNFNCLYCQNWSFKKSNLYPPAWRSVEELAREVNEQTSCVCFFGGDPTPQVPFALQASRRMRENLATNILRICWETNLSMHPSWLKLMAQASLASGGCIKGDIKAWNPQIHKALAGCDNGVVLSNFSQLARNWAPLRREPPLVIASTLLVPGYVDEKEVHSIASFIAQMDPHIPYALSVFVPQYHMEDFPITPRAQAEACVHAARKAGLENVRLANRSFLL